MHNVDACAVENVPTPHGRQALTPTSMEYWPISQRLHLEALESENCPTLQNKHPDEFVIPVALEYDPAMHPVHPPENRNLSINTLAGHWAGRQEFPSNHNPMVPSVL
mmetsp:Transcript_66252/g.177415  ORF Transcript_66252/g.177415 Transcript_66252/m.177415 type:complete len:107 (-) Transcript_66252:1643-1963(-)